MSNDEVVKVIDSYDDPLVAANMLVDVAKDNWESKDINQRRDDITVIVAKLRIDKSGVRLRKSPYTSGLGGNMSESDAQQLDNAI